MRGAVVMAYGTPASLDGVEAYYTHIRRGRPPTPEQLASLVARYEAIGTSPLRSITEAQVARIASALGDGWLVALGQKHAPPFVEDAVADLEEQGVDDLVGVVLAPHYSRGSVGEYVARLPSGARAVESWHDLPELVAFHAAAVRDGLASLPARTTVLFTAHSLPERVLEGDPYPGELAAASAAIAEAAGVGTWDIAWQSAGRTPDPWRGPDILEALGSIDADGVLVCPHGFVADGLEVLYDLDVEAAKRAAELGLAFGRTRMVNDDPVVLAALAQRVAAA